MKEYKDKDALKAGIIKSFEKYTAEFDSIPEAEKDLRLDGADRTPAENLAYQLGWTTLLLAWEQAEASGRSMQTPSNDFKWNQLGDLYQWFNQIYAPLPLQTLKARLEENVSAICTMIDTMSSDELFLPHQRAWADNATKTAVWPVSKFIHVNTVAPFGTFRTKIRTWKRLRQAAGAAGTASSAGAAGAAGAASAGASGR